MLKRLFLLLIFLLGTLFFSPLVNKPIFACTSDEKCTYRELESCSCGGVDMPGGTYIWCRKVENNPECASGRKQYYWSGLDCDDCSGGGAGSTTAYVEGRVTVEGTGSLAGPDGTAPDPGGELKQYCVEPKSWSCTGWGCSLSYRCDGMGVYPWGPCPGSTGDYRSYGVSGTNSLSVKGDVTINPNWTSRISVDKGDSSCQGTNCHDTGACMYTNGGPYFNFSGVEMGSHTYSINTATTDGYTPVSMSLTGATTASQTCDGTTTCSLTATLNAGGHNLAIVIRKAPKGTVQGFKRVTTSDSILNIAPAISQTVSLNGVANTSANPYFISVNAATNQTISVTVPSGYTVASTLCNNNTGCHTYSCATGGACPVCSTGVCPPGGAYLAGSTRTVNVNKNGYADLWWHYTAISPTCTMSIFPSTVTAGDSINISAKASAPGAPQVTARLYKTETKTLTDTNFGVCTAANACTVTPYTWQTLVGDIGKTFYVYCRGWNDDARECRPFLYDVYPADLDCDGVKDSACPDNDCKTVTVTAPGPWFQTQGGDVHAEGAVQSYVPSTVAASNQFFNLNLDTYPGLITYIGLDNYDFYSGSTRGMERSSTKKWLAQSAFSSSKSSFDYFFKKLGSPAVDTFNCDKIYNESSGGTKIYHVSSCSIKGSHSWSITNKSKVIVFVDNDFEVSLNPNNKRISVAKNGSFLAFIVKGKIIFDKGTGTKTLGYGEEPFLQGMYISDETIATAGTDRNGLGTGFRFIGGGSFYAQKGFSLGRTFKNDNATDPAELFIFRPDLVVNAPYELWSSKIDWQEVVP